jgi:hypothetical protein
MALNATTLASAIESDLLTLYDSAEDSPMTKETFAAEMASLIADNIVNHITANAEVSVSTSVNVASVTAVTPGTGVSGPGTGTGSGTGTVS